MTDTPDMPDAPADDLLESSDDFDTQKEQVDRWLGEEKEEREEKERRKSNP